MDLLSEIAKKYDCEKFTLCDYTKHYHRFFESFRLQPFNLFEIGVRYGASMSMWRDYFPNAYIYGIDVDPLCQQYTSERVQVYLLNQCDKQGLDNLAGNIGNFRVIVDDGSHIGSDMVDSFNVLAKYLVPGGFYVIEDILPEYYQQVKDGVYEYLAKDKDLKLVFEDQTRFRPEVGMWIVQRELKS